MIPNIQVSRYETNVHNTQHAFTIEMTPTLAKLLSSQTYTDKILAAIREPLSNAYDSHVRASTLDTPAKLHLPTQLEPQFTLRDFGTGLSHEDVIRLFFSYGVSDKRQTNAELGGLGIGAKAFFAYVDQATITSYHGGVRRVYSASKAANGLPQGMLVSETITDEPNGIELSYPVQDRHCINFREKTEQLLTHLNLKLDCNLKLNSPKVEEFYSADIDTPIGTAHCVLRTKRQENLVVMGGIAYTIPHAVDYEHGVNRYNHNYHNDGVIIHLPIGSVEISASRESLSPTDADKGLIVDILHQFQENLKAQDWTKMIQDSETWIAAVSAREYLSYMSAISRGKNLTEEDEAYSWRGISTRGAFAMPDLSVPITVIYRYSWRSNKYRGEIYKSDHVGKSVSRIFWVPKKKKITWHKWYEENRNLTVGSNGTIDIHIRAESLDEAKDLAKLVGFTAEVEDGSFLKTPPRPRTKSDNSRPTGIAWIDGAKGKLDHYSESELIYTDDHTQFTGDIGWLREQGIITGRVICFRPFGITAAAAAKRYAHLPTTLLDWCLQNPDKIDMHKWEQHMQMYQLHEAWNPKWMTKGRAIYKGKEVGFVIPIEWIHRNKPPAIAPAPDASALINAVQAWHDDVFAKLPRTVRRYLTEELTYTNDQDLFNLYHEMAA